MKAFGFVVGLAALLLVSQKSKTTAVVSGTSKPEPATPPPPPADLPAHHPGGYKAASPLTPEMVATAHAINATHPAINSVVVLADDFGFPEKDFIAWATYHLDDKKWVHAVEILEKA